ncbi:MAG TPA: carboxypeptidase-like regulatory domain-containing protein [Vicinamibacterales bacterium]|nr:carboxypeptidase-like regulatory domain-containing protein [Vicinamibacterales bacterium]
MTTRLLKVGLIALVFALISGPAFAQGGNTSSIVGVVTDSGGGVIPGATVTATNDATAGVSTAVTNASGAFTIPALNPGRYTVTVALQGFKSAVLKDVDVMASTPANVKAVLEVGGLSETVVVEGASAVIQTQSSAAASNVTTNQIANLPVGSRSTLEFVTFLPGVQTPGGSRDSIVNGLPQSSIAITLDGVSIQDNYLKTTDGFFARLSPRLDAVEEVTLVSAGNGANASSQGATQIQFTTRSGSNMFSGSAYHYYQSDTLNANSYFNIRRGLPKNESVQYQPGVRVGGPIVLPGIYDGRGKAFFFVNYEESRSPRTINTNADFLTPEAQSGIYRYTGTDGVQRAVNVYALAAANGQTSTPDPLVGKLLNDIAASAQGKLVEPIAGNPNAQRLRFQQDAKGVTRYPTTRVDYNLSSQHRLTGSWTFNDLVSTPDTTNNRQPRFPGFPVTGAQVSDRYVFTTALRSSISTNIVNELRFGMSGGATLFSPGLNAGMWNGALANQGGYDLGISAAGFAQTGGDNTGITNAGSGGGYSAREASTKFIESTLNWLKGSHSLGMGFNYTSADVWLLSETRVPSISFSLPTGDPALAMFSAGNFASSNSNQRNAARDLYAVLTGHVSQIGGTARLDQNTGQYVYNGGSRQEGRLPEVDLFIQDSWKARPNLSLNFGVRYVIQMPFYAKFGTYSTATPDDVFGVSGYVPGCDLSNATVDTCNLFKPGVMPGTVTTYQNFAKGVGAYNTDWNNFAPSFGVNWTPNVDGGFLRKMLGEPGDTSLSFGWARAFERHGMSDFTGVFGGNPGLTVNANRNVSNGNLGALPLLLRDGNLGAPATCTGAVTAACIPEAPSYPIAATTSGSVNIFDPNLQVPYSDSWTVGYQRAVGRKAAFEIRYIGTRNREQWRSYNFNEVNILDNGFLDEFRKAQSNLYANIAAGRGTNFAYYGPGTGTSPLPIYLAHFSGTSVALGGECASIAACTTMYSSSNFGSDDFVNALSRFNPNPFTPAGTNSNTGLRGSAGRRTSALNAGLPANFWIANPDVNNANVTGNGGFTDFDGMQMQFRRRMSGGLQFDVNYAYGKAYEATRYSFRVPFLSTRNTGSEGDVTHAIKSTFVYELPFGQGRRFGTGAGLLMDRLIGGWQVSGTMRFQTGELINLGNINVVGMSTKDVQNLFSVRYTGSGNTPIYMWPQDIIDNTIKAFSRDVNGFTKGEPTGRYFAPAGLDGCIETIANGYGDCGLRSFVITSPWQRNLDISLVKDVRFTGRKTFQLRLDFLNAFNLVDLDPESGVGATTLADWEITGSNGPRVIQLVTRFSW